jgi:hypothetical protein
MPTDVMVEAGPKPVRILLQELAEAMRSEAAAMSSVPGERLSSEEAALWTVISRSISPADMARYEYLRGRLEQETLTTAEHEELVTLSDEIEVLHAERLKAAIQLAALRGETVRDLESFAGIATT